MQNKKKRALSSHNGILATATATILALSVHSPARAQSDYDVTINTSSLAATGATLTFDFLAGGGAQSNTATISGFSTDGTLVSGGVNSGSVSGMLPGAATLTNASFFNELQQGMTLGSTISFQVDLTTNAPTGGSLPDTFSVFLLDPTASYSLTSTNDPTGSNSLATVQIDGSSTGVVGVYGGSGPLVPVTVSAVTGGGGTTQAPEIDPSSATSALTLLLGGLAVLRGRRIKIQVP
jgi:hypothetical protein